MITQDVLDKVFSTLRAIHKAHWKTPRADIVTSEIKRKGVFVFRIGSNPWVAEICIDTDVRYVVNENLALHMKQRANEFKQQFDATLLPLEHARR